MAARILRSKLKFLPTGTKWNTVDGHHYEVTAVYRVRGKYLYHILEDGKRGAKYGNYNGSPKLITEEEVRELRGKKV
jgi:hypothetical protein